MSWRPTTASRRVLEKRFKAILHRSVHQEIRRIRVNNIVRLLVGTDLSVADIAAHCGFDGVEHIVRYFRKETGVSLASTALATCDDRKNGMLE